MKCLNCGNDIVLEESKYCNACGAKLPIKKVQCSKCGKMSDITSNFCNNCGEPLEGGEIFLIEEQEPEVLEEKEIFETPPKIIKLFALLGFLLSFSPILLLPTKIASIILSIISLSKLRKAKKEHPEMRTKKQKVFSILGIIISSLIIIGYFAFYLFIIFNIGFLDGVFTEIPKYFL